MHDTLNNPDSLQTALFENKHLATCLLDKAGNILAFNHSFQKQLGNISSDPSVSPTIWKLNIWDQNYHYLNEAWKNLLNNGFSCFSQSLHVENGPFLYEILFVQINDGKEILVLFYPKLQDLDNRSDGKDLGNMASFISHELRAPVANLAYLLSIFDSENTEKEELDRFVKTLDKLNSQTLDIINEMAGVVNAKIELGQEASPSLMSMISTVLKRFEKEMLQTKARVIIDIQDHTDWLLPEGAFDMILGQVISNSLKFRKHNETPKIVITCSREKGDRIIEVEDNGLGFDYVENERRVFGLFQTFHDHPDSRGIGLFQAKKRLLSIGGAISLSSKKDVGTTVTLNFKQNELEEAPLYN